MASRPLPPGRRSRGPRVASGLHNLPEVKLLDVSETPTSAAHVPVRSAAIEPQTLPASTEKEKTTTTTSFKPVAIPQRATVEPQSSAAKALVASAVPAYSITAEPVKPVIADEQPAAAEKPEPRRVEHAPVSEHQSAYAPAAVVPPVQTRSPSMEAPVVVPPPATKPISLPPTAAPAVTAPSTKPRAPVSQNEVATTVTDLGEFHPFYLLLPVDAVPPVPESIECIYDEAAVEMQKNVLKVVKKLLGRDKIKLEDFKINSRLFGNNFMEPYEYLESLVKDFGGVRALQLVPCLLMIQADFMRRSGLLLAARNYRMRHIAALEAECQALHAVEASPVLTSSPAPALAPTPAPSPAPALAPQSIAPPSQPLPVAAVEEAAEMNDRQHVKKNFVEETVDPLSLPEEVAPEQKAELGFFAALVGSEAVATITEVAHSEEKPDEDGALDPSAVGATSPLDVPFASSDHHVVEEAEVAEAKETPAFQPSVANVWTEPHVEIESDEMKPIDEPKSNHQSVESSVEIAQPPDPVEPEAPEQTETKCAKADEEVAHKPAHSSRADDEYDVDMLPAAFRQAFASSDSEPVVAKPANVVPVAETSSSKTHKPDIEPTSMSSTLSNSNRSSFAEAENLFGERMSTGSTSSDNAENLFGESLFQPAAAAPAPSAAVPASATETASSAPASFAAPKREHSQLLFGFATAGADTDSNSDSDDSGFSSP